jgi:hypothetical protein
VLGKGWDGLLGLQKGLGLFPDTLAFVGLIEHALGQWHLAVVDEGVDLLLDDGDEVLRIFSGNVEVFEVFV